MKSQILTKPQTVTSRQIADDEFLTTHELMKLLKVKHRKTIYELIKDGMPAILVGKNYRFIKHEAIGFLKGQTLKKRKGKRRYASDSVD